MSLKFNKFRLKVSIISFLQLVPGDYHSEEYEKCNPEGLIIVDTLPALPGQAGNFTNSSIQQTPSFSGLTTLLSFERTTILEFSRKRGTCFCVYLPMSYR